MRIRVLGIILAGGKGTRLYPLTKERAKPAVPFGGKYRIIDFVLSNFINSGIHSVYVLTQFRSQSLLQHINEGWQFSGLLKNHFIIPVPAQMRAGETWYQGTADAIYQNINLVEQADPRVVAIFGGDHVYRMNIASMIEAHLNKSAEVTVAAMPVPKDQASEFGVIETAEDGRILAFHEKNPDAPTIPGNTHQVYASMGNYIFSTRTLLRLPAPVTTSDAIFCPNSPAKWKSTRTISRPTASRATLRTPFPTGGTSGRSTRIMKPTWTCGRSVRRSTFTTGNGRCG